MAVFTLSKSLQLFSSDNTDDNTISIGNFGQKPKLMIKAIVHSGTVSFAVNTETDADSVSIAAGSAISFQLKESDVIHFSQASASDTFSIVATDFGTVSAGVEAGSSSTSPYPLPYKVYCAKLTQNDNTDLAVTVFENTLGFTPVWTYESAGNIVGTYTGGFPVAKTAVFLTNNSNPIYSVASNNGNDANQIYVSMYDISTDLDTDILEASIEIRVYP